MYVGKIKLKNLRGFTDLEFDLARPDGSFAGWTVFTGDNGSGKSTLLRAIAIGLAGRDNGRALQPSFRGWIRHDGADSETSIELEIVTTGSDDSAADKGRPPEKNFPAKIVIENGSKEPTLKPTRPIGRPKTYRLPDRTIWSADAHGWFACGYGPFRRIFGASNEAIRQMVAPSTERFVTMFQEAASLAEVDTWLRNLKHKELENKADEGEQLRLLLRILGDDLMPNQMSVDRVDSDGLWLRDRNGVELTWPDMSDGYRSALALLADILRHLINTYGVKDLCGTTPEGRVYINRSGVVLIDEVDAHLHPEWQREIGFWLCRHFPKIQFLVATHSPLICQAAHENGLFVLPEPGSGNPPRPLSDEEYQRVITSRPDTILLTAAFGLQNTRSPRAVEARAAFAQLNAKQRAGGSLTADEKRQLELFEPFATDD